MAGRYGGGPKCPKCGKTVFFNEEVLAANEKWHKMCFKCTDCNKMLDSTSVAIHENELYCKSCHRRNFGIKGYGYGLGAGTLASETEGTDSGGASGYATGGTGYSSYGVGKTGGGGGGGGSQIGGGGGGGGSQIGGGERCPRCGQRVYIAEKIVGAGSSWHKSCFSCATCKKKLDSTTVTDNDGEVYCKACYGRHFGPKGFGFGLGAGTLTNT